MKLDQPGNQHPKTPRELSAGKKAAFFISYLIFLAIIFLGASEYLLRKEGIKPWHIKYAPITVEPGKKFFQKNNTLGYTHIPGHFTVTLETGYAFTVTNLPNTLRATHAVNMAPSAENKEEIWIFGCSYTYGWSLNDEETYPWLLQEKFPTYEVVNFGVNGYGTIHSLIQFREALKNKKPRIAILSYANFHDERNTFLRNRQKAVAPWNKLGPLVQPYARLDKDGKLQYAMAKVEYQEFPLMRELSLAHFIEMQYDRYEDFIYRSHAVSEALVLEMQHVAKANGVIFILANIEGGESMQQFATANGIPNVDISVDLDQPGMRNIPHDGHPSAIADRQYADRLEHYLKTNILTEQNAQPM